MKIIITNGFIVTPGNVFKGTIVVNDGIIEDVTEKYGLEEVCSGMSAGCEVVDADGFIVMPGLIDLHCDILEHTVQPRKGVFFPESLAIGVLQTQLLSAGITTMYHAISLSGEPGVRSNETALQIINEIERFRKSGKSRMHHKIHARYELYNLTGLETIRVIFRDGLVDLFSIMDHSDKYSKKNSFKEFKAYIEKNSILSSEELDGYIETHWDRICDGKSEIEAELIELAARYKVPFATHDDDTPWKIDSYMHKGVSMSEFPLNEETARYAVENNMFSIVGAPNIIRNKSHTGNLSAGFAIRNEIANVICSDYYCFALLASVFKLYEEGMSLDRAVSFAAATPACAIGASTVKGTLEKGKMADIILVRHSWSEFPEVVRAMVEGKWVLTV